MIPFGSMDAEQEKKDKAAFAAFLSQTPDDPLGAALKVYPGNTGMALRISNYWVFDPFVTEERARIAAASIGDDPEAVKKYLDTKARKLIEDETRVQAKDRLSAMEFLAKLHKVIDVETDADKEFQLPPEPTYKVVKPQTDE